MRRIIALLTALLMICSLAACGGDEKAIADLRKEVPTQPAQTQTGTDVPSPETQATETPTEAPTEPAANLTVHENTLFSIGYDESLGWTLNEDNTAVKDYGGWVKLELLDSEGEKIAWIEVDTEEDDHWSFRNLLQSRNFDARTYVDGGYDLVDIGGQPLLQFDDGDYLRYYFGRNEAAGVDLEVTVYRTDENSEAEAAAVLESLTFHLSDVGNVDAPWYWEGQPFTAQTKTTMVGSYTLQGEFVPMTQAHITYETFEHDIEVIGDKAYILSDRILYVYAFDGAALTYESTIDLASDQYTALSATAGGHLIASALFTDAKGFDAGVQSVSYTGVKNVEVAPDGTWGISYSSSVDQLMKITFGEAGAVTTESISVPELTFVTDVWIDGENVIIAGTNAEDDSHCIAVYDYSFNLKTVLNKASGATLGSAGFVAATDNGYMVLDANMRTVILFNKDGSFIGYSDEGAVFSTYYPWIAEAEVLSDGTVMVLMSEKRADESGMELIAFKLSGF